MRATNGTGKAARTRAPGKRNARGRFQTRYDARTLVDVVAAVARVAKPTEPESISQRDYDNARSLAGYPDAPSARQIATRLRIWWPDLIALAFDPARDIDKALGKRLGAEEEPATLAAIAEALKTVAFELDKKTLTPLDYSNERERLYLQATRARRARLHLPSVGQILYAAASWDEALAEAGLAPRPAVAGVGPGLAIVDALELCLEAHGALPSLKELEVFAAANNFSLANRERGQGGVSTYLAELTLRRSAWGKWTPTKMPKLKDRPDYAQPMPGLAVDARAPRRRRWTRAECLDALARLLVEWPSDKRLTQRAYQQAVRGRRDLPPLVSVQQHGPLREMLAEARKSAAK